VSSSAGGCILRGGDRTGVAGGVCGVGGAGPAPAGGAGPAHAGARSAGLGPAELFDPVLPSAQRAEVPQDGIVIPHKWHGAAPDSVPVHGGPGPVARRQRSAPMAEVREEEGEAGWFDVRQRGRCLTPAGGGPPAEETTPASRVRRPTLH
jgi:hypothetical protein